MMTGIQIRNILHELVGEKFPQILAANRCKRKLDRVEVFPTAAIYLKEMESEPGGMRGLRDREHEIDVVFYRNETADVEEALAMWADLFEAEVEAARKAQRFGTSLTMIYLSAAVMSITPDSAGRAGSVTLTFTAESTAQL